MYMYVKQNCKQSIRDFNECKTKSQYNVGVTSKN